ncbi:MAG: hypothetical protein LUD77_05525 [Clostridiales bacterium]|nr:hypothetical protein [Clostridiales bacterium]
MLKRVCAGMLAVSMTFGFSGSVTLMADEEEPLSEISEDKASDESDFSEIDEQVLSDSAINTEISEEVDMADDSEDSSGFDPETVMWTNNTSIQ